MKTIIQIGSRDFGRCPLASHLNRALWPVFDKPALQHLLDGLIEQGLRRFVISCESRFCNIQQHISWPDEISVQFREETLPRGPAGCIYDAVDPNEDDLLLIMPGCIVNPPDVEELLELHSRQHADMTLFLNPSLEMQKELEPSRIYLCHPSVVDFIPEQGYFDLKENLIPELVQAGKIIQSAHMSSFPGNFRNWQEYVDAMKYYILRRAAEQDFPEAYKTWPGRENVWVGNDTVIPDDVKISGPVVIGSRVKIGNNAAIFGPTMFGNENYIGRSSIIEESILWNGTVIGEGSQLKSALVDKKSVIDGYSDISCSVVSGIKEGRNNLFKRLQKHRIIKSVESDREEDFSIKGLLIDSGQHKYAWLGIIAAIVSIIFSYWDPVLRELWKIWLESDEYSSGLLVPVLAIYALWSRRGSLKDISISPSLLGLFALIASQGFRFFGLYYMYTSAERISFVMSIGSFVLLLFGVRFFIRFIPIFIFLFLMLPLPNRIDSLIAAPLQEWATASAVFCLETLGFSVIRQGNIIDLNGTLVAVAEACNGLRMLNAFIVVCFFVVLIARRRWWEKVIILISSIPIGLACNTIRLTATAIAFTILNTEKWEKVFHDYGGFAMMPVALLFIIFELWLLSHIVIEPKKEQEEILYRTKKTDNTVASKRKMNV